MKNAIDQHRHKHSHTTPALHTTVHLTRKRACVCVCWSILIWAWTELDLSECIFPKRCVKRAPYDRDDYYVMSDASPQFEFTAKSDFSLTPKTKARIRSTETRSLPCKWRETTPFTWVTREKILHTHTDRHRPNWISRHPTCYIWACIIEWIPWIITHMRPVYRNFVVVADVDVFVAQFGSSFFFPISVRFHCIWVRCHVLTQRSK